VTDSDLRLPNPDVIALVSGESIVAFTDLDTVAAGSTVTLIGTGPRPPGQLKPAYRRWHDAAIPDGQWTATVDVASPADAMDPAEGAARYILAAPGEGVVLALRVSGPGGPVLSDAAYSARRSSFNSALHP
jgi:hypothetical protein